MFKPLDEGHQSDMRGKRNRGCRCAHPAHACKADEGQIRLVHLREPKRDATFHRLRPARLDDDVPQKMQKQSKRQRQSKRRKRLKMRAPPKPDLRMEIYNESNGVVTHLTWRTEETYRAVAAFLKNLPGQGGLIPGDPEKPEFYIVETRQQMDAFWTFVQALSKAQR